MNQATPTPPRMLTVAGSDSGGGAGIQADLRTAALLGCHGLSAITAVTAQNSLGVQGIYPLSPDAVAAQLDSVLSDIGADAAKTGMLFSAPLIRVVAQAFRRRPVPALVVDPVMVAKGGAPLLQEDAQEALRTELLPLATLVTPNLPEAEALAGMRIVDEASREEACRKILALGPQAVLLKGGHGEGEIIEDLFLSAQGGREALISRRLDTRNTHGTGCTLSAAVAAHLALGHSLPVAVRRAHAFLRRAVLSSYALGAGHGPTNPYAAASAGGEGAVIERLYKAWEILEEANPHGLIPEVQSNLAEALPDAVDFTGVAAFPGRIVRSGEKVRRIEGPRFGASRHMAKILLASARRQSPFRAVMNIRYGADVLAAVAAAGLTVEGFSRYEEPPEVKAAEGSTLEWGTGSVLDARGYAPDAIFDEGDVGKEPMIRIFGTDALEVARRVAAVWSILKGDNP